MKIRVISLFLTLILLPCIPFAAGAAEKFEMAAAVNNETRVITVTGKAPAAWGKRTITVVLLKPGQADVNLDEADAAGLSAAVAAIADTACDAEGDFSLKLLLGADMPPAADGAPASYTVVLGASGLAFDGVENKKTVSVYSATAIPNAISALKSAGGRLESVIRSNAELLSLDLSGIFASEGAQVSEFMNLYFANGDSDAFDSIAKIQETYQLACRLTELLKAAEADRVRVLEENAALFGVNTSDEDYGKARQSAADQYVKRLEANLLPDRTAPSNYFAETVALAVLNSAGRDEVDSILEKNRTLFNISLDGDYKELDPYEVAKALVGKNFITSDEVKTAFESRVKELLEEDGDDDRISSGGGGGGGGKVSVSGNLSVQDALIPINPEVKELPFTDLGQYGWATASIEKLYSLGIISGMSETEFAPAGLLTREQLAKILSIAFDIEQGGETPFDDISQEAWYVPYVAGVYNADIVRGISDSQFGVGQAVSRQDMMVMLHRILIRKSKAIYTKEMAFADRGEIAGYALEAVDALYAAGAISGTDKGEIEPSRACTRAEAAKIICAVMQYGEGGAQ